MWLKRHVSGKGEYKNKMITADFDSHIKVSTTLNFGTL